MIVKELLFYFKKYKLITFLIYFQITFFLLMLGTFLSFSNALKYEIGDLGRIYNDKTIYQIIDSYYDGGAFQDFLSNKSSLERLKSFYNGLDQATGFNYLAMNDQHILIEDDNVPLNLIEKYDKGNQQRRVTLQDKDYIPVESFQMNQESFRFFNLKVSDGRAWTTIDFEERNEPMPIILGSSYRNLYKIGDTFSINFYTKNIQVEIIGFLEAAEKVFYMGETEFYLDNHMLLPNINYQSPKNDEDTYFQQITYFAMVNGYVIVKNNSNAIQKMMNQIEVIADKTEFEYSFIGLNPHFQKYNGLMKTMEENKELVSVIFIFTFFLNLIMVSILLLLQQNRRFTFYAVHFINGAGKKDVLIQMLSEIGSIIFISFLTCCFMLEYIIKIGDINVYLLLLITTLFMIVFSSLLPLYKLMKRPIAKYLQYEDEGKF